MKRNRNTKPRRKATRNSNSRNINTLVSLSKISGIKQTVVTRDWLRGDPLILTVLNTAVVFTGTPYVQFDSTSILATSSETRVNTFQDWRILKIVAKITPLSPAFAGSTSFGFSEDSADAGNTNFATQGRCLVLSNNGNNSSVRRLSWTAANFDDLSFHRTSASVTPVPVIFNAYTDNTNFGTVGATGNTIVFRVEFDLLCDMRGLSA